MLHIIFKYISKKSRKRLGVGNTPKFEQGSNVPTNETSRPQQIPDYSRSHPIRQFPIERSLASIPSLWTRLVLYKVIMAEQSPLSCQTLEQAAAELEALRGNSQEERRHGQHVVGFPRACRALLRSLPGNTTCIDCGAPNPDWASLSYGSLICLICSGRHRSYGVQTSFVRSVDMDAWSQAQIVAMLEGGNGQLWAFFERHDLGNSSRMANKRYKTKAALFYRKHLQQHASHVSDRGVYEGRDSSRARPQSPTSPPQIANAKNVPTCKQEAKLKQEPSSVIRRRSAGVTSQ